MPKVKKKETKKLVKYDLACGDRLQKGFIGVDIVKKGTKATLQIDLLKTPWAIESNSADELFCAHFVEHIPHGTDGLNDPFWDFFNEAWRILKPGGVFRVLVPYFTSVRAFQDPTHQRFVSELTFLYLSKGWRKINKLEHYPVFADFQTINLHHAINKEFSGKAQEAVQYAGLHNWNVIDDLLVTLQKPKDE
jgi:predicted SAM-dependent methyltransferase